MTIARILVPVRGDGKTEGVLAHAAVIAKRFDAHIEAVHCRARPQDMVPYGVIVPAALRERIKESAATLADEEEAHLHRLYSKLMARLGIEECDEETDRAGRPPLDRTTCSWSEAEGKQVDVIKEYGRLADLIAVARPDRDRNIGFNTLKAAIFTTGRPVLLCPPLSADSSPPAAVGEHIAVAWNGSLEASRAFALAAPLLAKASSVTVLDGGSEDHGADGRAAIRALRLKGTEARHRRIEAGSHPGRAILAEAVAAGADLVVMGAYGHSRDLEAVFGGATQEVVDRTEMPILFAH